MIDVSILLLTGPALVAACAAAAMFFVGARLGSRRPAFFWGLGFAASALQWTLLGAHLWTTRATPLLEVIGDVLGVTSTVLYTCGFAARAGSRTRALFALALPTNLLCAAGLIAAGGSGGLAATTALLKAACFCCAMWQLCRQRRPTMTAEWATLLVLILVAASYAAVALNSPSGGDTLRWAEPIVAFVAAPITAAVALFTLLLITADFSAERWRLVRTDPLTGLLNRSGFDHVFAAALGNRRPLTLAIADIDHFKAINDRHGHAEGDTVLVRFARALSATLRPGETVARIGGEEFALILSNGGARAAARIERLRARIAADVGLRVLATASFGIAERVRGESAADLVARADRALYAAKAGGRNRAILSGQG